MRLVLFRIFDSYGLKTSLRLFLERRTREITCKIFRVFHSSKSKAVDKISKGRKSQRNTEPESSNYTDKNLKMFSYSFAMTLGYRMH